MRGDRGEGGENGEGLIEALVIAWFFVCCKGFGKLKKKKDGGRASCSSAALWKAVFWRAYLALYMPEIHAQLLEQRRFAIVSLRAECCQPSCAQPSLLSHPSAHTRRGAEAMAAKCWGAAESARGRTWVCLRRLRLGAWVAILGL